jgi:hypothetical protein
LISLQQVHKSGAQPKPPHLRTDPGAEGPVTDPGAQPDDAAAEDRPTVRRRELVE